MSDDATQGMSVKRASYVLPFAIQATHPRCSNLRLKCATNVQLRSAISPSKGAKDNETGDIYIPVDQSQAWGTLGDIPGMVISVNPEQCTYQITDPLNDKGNESVLTRITRFLRSKSAISSHVEVRGAKGSPVIKLDIHRMKSLIRELCDIVESGEGAVYSGVLPDRNAIDFMPGKYLLNPACEIPNSQPRFEDEWDDWFAQVTRMGG